MNQSLDYHRHLQAIADEDVKFVKNKDASYAGSWKKRGGIGAFMMLARKWDRLENMASVANWDIFKVLFNSFELNGEDGSPIAEIRDLRRYLLLLEAYIEETAPEVIGTEQIDNLFDKI